MRVIIDSPPNQDRPDQVLGLFLGPHNKLSQIFLQFSKKIENKKELSCRSLRAVDG